MPGLFTNLSVKSKTSKQAAPEPPKTAEASTTQMLTTSQMPPAVKRPTAPRKEPTKPEANPKLPLDRPASRHRIITRASFEMYQDQVHVLRQVSLQAKLIGDKLSMSEKVREALDSYLTDKNLI